MNRRQLFGAAMSLAAGPPLPDITVDKAFVYFGTPWKTLTGAQVVMWESQVGGMVLEAPVGAEPTYEISRPA
jgi:hypothetical protein